MHDEKQMIAIADPILIVFKADGKTVTRLHPPADYSHEIYGILVADIIRHIANWFQVEPKDILEWTVKELESPTTDIEGGDVN
jgi:hypothetical protein